jgi:hypothetical protein
LTAAALATSAAATRRIIIFVFTAAPGNLFLFVSTQLLCQRRRGVSAASVGSLSFRDR